MLRNSTCFNQWAHALNIRAAFELERTALPWKPGGSSTDNKQHSSTSRCCFHYFQVSLVPKITQIVHTNVSDTFFYVKDLLPLNIYLVSVS